MKFDQCLFGYQDGHRLLASSLPLGDQTSSLTELSDIAPGTVFGQSDGYWTGVPAPEISRYALMRTWPAPEMPRPGCVWTHGLLLETAALEKLTDLSLLVALARRPSGPNDGDRYRRPLTLETRLLPESQPAHVIDDRIVRDLLATLYATNGRTVAISAPGKADPAMFAIWSQQWPRLRRNFRFQTAATREARSSSAARLDVAVQLEAAERATEPNLRDGWIEAAVADVAEGSGGALRSFLLRYGQDTKRQRGSFRPLVEMKLLHDRGEDNSGSRLLELVTASFSDRSDAAVLKQDVVDGVLVPQAQLDVLWFVLAHGGDAVFPSPTTAGVARLALLWPKRPEDLLHLAERTANAEDMLGKSVFATITGAVPSEDFWAYTASYPLVRERMVCARPELLASNGALALDNATLSSLLQLLPAGSPVVRELVPQLLSRDDGRLAATAIDRSPQTVASQVVAATDGGSAKLARAWVRGLVQRPAVLLDPVVMGRVSRTSLLYEFGEALGWLTPVVAEAGTEPWKAALGGIADDLSDDRRDTLNAFLLALALASGGDGGRRMLERFFDVVHGQILRSRLPWRARDILSPQLPDLGWSRGWDLGLRLRLSVVNAYVRNNYPPESFAALAKNRKTRTMLTDAAAEVDGGKPFAEAVAGR